MAAFDSCLPALVSNMCCSIEKLRIIVQLYLTSLKQHINLKPAHSMEGGYKLSNCTLKFKKVFIALATVVNVTKNYYNCNLPP